MLGQTFNYAFDDIGNRKSAGSGTLGAQRTKTYGVNLLNQYTNRTVPGYLEVNGSADAAASVTVNGASPSQQGEYYRQEVSVNNASAGLVQWLTSRATNNTGTSIVARLSFVPQNDTFWTFCSNSVCRQPASRSIPNTYVNAEMPAIPNLR